MKDWTYESHIVMGSLMYGISLFYVSYKYSSKKSYVLFIMRNLYSCQNYYSYRHDSLCLRDYDTGHKYVIYIHN